MHREPAEYALSTILQCNLRSINSRFCFCLFAILRELLDILGNMIVLLSCLMLDKKIDTNLLSVR